MDIYTMIRQDHEDARHILKRMALLPMAQSAARFALFTEIKDAIAAHNEVEAGSFYIALEAYPATRARALHSSAEHKEITDLLADLSDASMPTAQWEQKFSEFTKVLLLHLEEEEGEVFDAARQVLSPSVALELGGSMQRLKRKRRRLLQKVG